MGQVGRDDLRLTTSESNLTGEALKAILPAGDQDDMETLAGELAGSGSTDATRGAGDDCDFVEPTSTEFWAI